MIWYRHWIEMRSGLCVAAIFMALMSLLPNPEELKMRLKGIRQAIGHVVG